MPVILFPDVSGGAVVFISRRSHPAPGCSRMIASDVAVAVATPCVSTEICVVPSDLVVVIS